MADKKDVNQGAETPEDPKPVEGAPEELTRKEDITSDPPEDSADIVDAEFEEIPGTKTDDEVTDPEVAPETEPVNEDGTTDPDAVEPVEPEETYDDLPPAEPILLTDEDLKDEAPAETVADTPAEEPFRKPAPGERPERIVEKTIVQKRGFLPVFLGGIVAALLGFTASRMGLPEGIESALPPSLQQPDYATPIAALEDTTATQTDQLTETGQQVTDLGGRLDSLSTQISDVDGKVEAIEIPDITPLQDGIAGLTDDIAAIRESIEAARAEAAQGVENLTLRHDSLDVRVSTLEKRPIAENLSDDAIAAYERELDGVRRDLAAERDTVREEFDALIAEQGERMTGIVNDERARIDALLAEAQAMVDDAKLVSEQTAQIQVEANRAQVVAAAQSAIALVRGALNEGQPYADNLAPISEAGLEIPAALSDPAPDGVATQGTLLADFPAAARDALDAARHADPESTRGLGAFLKRELGARSTTPQEGDDADAILSRAEAALKREDLSTALTELQALPDPAAEAMANWVELATVRRDALAALDAVAADLNTN